MKKPNITKTLKEVQIKKTYAFSNQKNKNWKTPKWKRNTSINISQAARPWNKKRKRKGFKSWYFFNNKSLRKRGIRFRAWRLKMRQWRKIDITLLKKLYKKIRHWKLYLKFCFNRTKKFNLLPYYYYKENFFFGIKINRILTNKLSLTRNTLKAALFYKKRSLALKNFLYQSSLYHFRKNYKRKFSKKNRRRTQKSQTFFFKSLEMNLIKFSLINDRNWFYFFKRNQMLLPKMNFFYDYFRSKRIKEFFDIFTRYNLFNQVKQINFLYSRRHFQYIHNNTKNFEDFAINKQKFPWWEPLIFTQQIYRNRLSWRSQQFWFRKPFLLFAFKFYYRYKKPWEEKKNFLYSNFSYLVFNMTYNNILEKPKRVKQLLNKILLPFYGHIKPKQLQSIYMKNHYVKSKRITSSDLFLSKLETRLDVLIYRLNLAPNIVWARRLIKAGLVFLQQNKSKKYIKDCFTKQSRYPIKLNNHFDLYPPSFKDVRIKEFFFKTQPILSIDFRAKAGDIIQCHPFSLYQKWNIRPDLLNKPIPNYLLTKTKIDLNTEWNHWFHYLINNKKYLLLYNAAKKNRWKVNKTFTPYRFEWGNDLSKETTSFFLFNPQRKDFYINDRNSSLFLNWIIQ